MSSPFPWRPEARQRVAWHRRSVGHGQPIRRRGARAFPVFSGRRISVDIRLLQRRKFVDRAKNSVDRPSNEFDTQVLELSLYSLPTSTPKRQHRRFSGSFFSVSVFPTRHWHGAVKRSLRLGSWPLGRRWQWCGELSGAARKQTARLVTAEPDSVERFIVPVERTGSVELGELNRVRAVGKAGKDLRPIRRIWAKRLAPGDDRQRISRK
jgi:hypothetical protein